MDPEQSLSNSPEFEVSVLRLHGEGHFAHACTLCGEPIKKNKTGLCHRCSGKRFIDAVNDRRRKKSLEELDKYVLLKVEKCPRCGQPGSLHKRWVLNGRSKKRYEAYYVAHYSAESRWRLKWCYMPKKTALTMLSLSNTERSC